MISPIVNPIRFILERVAAEYGYKPEELLVTRNGGGYVNPWRMPPLTICRDVAMLLAFQLVPGKSVVQIGKVFNRDPKTVRNNINVAGKLLERSLIERTRYWKLHDELKLAVPRFSDDHPIAMRRRSADKKWASQASKPATPTLAEETANE